MKFIVSASVIVLNESNEILLMNAKMHPFLNEFSE